MPSSETTILFVGDMHLGTRIARLPAGAGDPDALGPAEAWRRTVDAALEHRVQAVALAGDVVNQRNQLFEARRPLDRGLARLAEAGIPVVAVAGNHDTDTLPALAAGEAPLALLGPGGTWSGFDVAGHDGPPVRIVGWSFPAEHHEASPLATPAPAADGGTVTFGLLHADLDAGASGYAPVASAELTACGYDGWFLGHIHTPGPVPDDDTPFYLGSLTGLDPSETGVHGPVLVTVHPDRSQTRERLPLAPLRWARIGIDCGPLQAPEADLPSVLERALGDFVASAGLSTDTAVGARIELTGEVEHPQALADTVAKLDLGGLVTEIAGVTVFVDRIDCRARARVNLEALSAGSDPLGLLARRILVLEGVRTDADLDRRLLDRARTAVAKVDGHAACRRLNGILDDTGLRRLAVESARNLLHHLLAERSGT